MKKADNIIIEKTGDEEEMIKSINGRFFYVKCKVRELKHLLTKL